MSDWIPCSERMPDYGKDVEVRGAYYNLTRWGGAWWVNRITHWREIPKEQPVSEPVCKECGGSGEVALSREPCSTATTWCRACQEPPASKQPVSEQPELTVDDLQVGDLLVSPGGEEREVILIQPEWLRYRHVFKDHFVNAGELTGEINKGNLRTNGWKISRSEPKQEPATEQQPATEPTGLENWWCEGCEQYFTHRDPWLNGRGDKKLCKDCYENQGITQPVNPYAVEIRSCVPGDPGTLTIDVYSIGKAYPMADAVFHAVKKCLLAGKRRGDKGYEQDLREAVRSLQRELDDVTKGKP